MNPRNTVRSKESPGNIPGFFCLFNTALGKCALVWTTCGIKAVYLPEQTDKQTLKRLLETHPSYVESNPSRQLLALIVSLQLHLSGQKQDFTRVQLDWSGISPFQQKVYLACQKVMAGKTVSYSELAALAGCPKAYRALGRALGDNPFLILVPCHRVTGKNGQLVGFSAYGGCSLKQKLLEIEGVALPEIRKAGC